MICIGGVPGLKRHFGGAGPQASIFYMIHRGGVSDLVVVEKSWTGRVWAETIFVQFRCRD